MRFTIFFILLALFFSPNLWAQKTNAILPEYFSETNVYLADEYLILSKQLGDLNFDGKEDLVLVIQKR